MTALEVIEEIKALPKDEQTEVFELPRHATEGSRLSPEELGPLARRMAETKDHADADRLQEGIVRGFCGVGSHA